MQDERGDLRRRACVGCVDRGARLVVAGRGVSEAARGRVTQRMHSYAFVSLTCAGSALLFSLALMTFLGGFGRSKLDAAIVRQAETHAAPAAAAAAASPLAASNWAPASAPRRSKRHADAAMADAAATP